MHDHAIWLVTTVFYIMMPGLGRGMYIAVEKWHGPDNFLALNISSVIIIVALLILAWRWKKLTHPAVLLGVGVNIPTFFVYWLGQQQWYIDWIKNLMVYKLS